MKVILCGFGRAGQEILLQLLLNGTCGIKDILVFTHQHDENEGFLSLLRNLNLPYSLESINRCLAMVEAFRPDYLISAYYRTIIHDRILEQVDYKAINLHPSLLPAYRGCFSGVWAILNGEKETGITYHYITSKVDGGNILVQKKIAMQEGETAYSLYHKCIALFIRYFPEAFDRLVRGDLGVPQNPEAPVSYYKREVPYGGILDAGNISYEYAQRFVNALYFPPHPSACFLIDGETVAIQTAEALACYKHYFRSAE